MAEGQHSYGDSSDRQQENSFHQQEPILPREAPESPKNFDDLSLNRGSLTVASRRPAQEVPNRDAAQQRIAVPDEDFGSFPAVGRPIFRQPAQPGQIKGSGRRWAAIQAIKLVYDLIARGRD